MAYDIYPAVDENYQFPEEVQKGLFPYRGAVPSGSDMNDLRLPGTYGIPGGAHAGSLSNLPPGVTTASVFVIDSGQSSNQMQSQIIFGNVRGGTWYRTTLATSGEWGSWTILGWDRDNRPGYSDFNEIKTPGVYRLPKSSSHTHSNSPSYSEDANLMVLPTGNSDLVTQMFWETGSQGSISVRHSITATTFTEWSSIGGGDDYWAQHSLRVSEFKRRRGGVIGTNGYGAVAFRFDHNWDDFIATNGIASLMEKHSIVGSMAVPAMEFDPNYSNQSTTGSFSTMQAWALNHGMEIMSHSYTHKDAQSVGELVKEIQTSREYLETQMPQIKVDVWTQPGTVAPEGKETYMGMGTVSRIDRLYGSRAGRMLLGNYAVVSGHMDGYFREINGDVDQGLAHYTIESDTTATNAINLINQASRSGTGIVLMMHPNVVGSSGKMSLSVLEQIFIHVANLRDSGKIQNLTVGGLALADSSSDRRHNLAINGNFLDNFENWSGTSGWVVEPTGGVRATSSTVLEQGEYWSRRAAIAGSWRELVVECHSGPTSSPSGEIRVWDPQTGSGLDFTRTFTIQPNSPMSVRIPFGIPFKGDASTPTIQPKWSIKRTSGGPLFVKSVRVQPI